jgi:four helix bundle protein
MLLAKKVYQVQKELPKSELYGLGDQIRRAVVSVPSNIAEGFGRGSDTECKHFLSIARGSLFEVKMQLQLASELGFLQLMPDLTQLIDEVGKLITGLSKTLTAPR